MRKKTTKEFINKAQEIHGNRYDYSEVEYIDNKTTVTIICHKHGEFKQTPNSHLQKKGCKKCTSDLTSKRLTKTTEQFIKEAKEVHGERYDYSKVEYKNSKLKVQIICPVHGIFEQRPGGHLAGKGCKQCSGKFKKTTREFIGEAKILHKDKYNYSKVKYIGAKTNVIIGCKIHGDFQQSPTSHLSGRGCPYCAGNVKKTTGQFIKEAKEVHGERYNYSKVEYTGAMNEVTIICGEHGKFKQIAMNHLKGFSCSACSGMRKKTTEHFIKDAKDIHGDRYEYSEVCYINNKEPIIINCKEHGPFKQFPNNHLKGKGCPKCANLKTGLTLRKSTDEFIEEAKNVHGNRYDYSEVDYIRGHKKVLISCKEHGPFQQDPFSHLNGVNCPKCTGSFLKSTEQFIEEAVSVHGNRYGYSEVEYIGGHKKVLIICKEHNCTFEQTPFKHLSGQGCPSCADYGFDVNEPGLLYYITLLHDGCIYYKIGITNFDLDKRYQVADRKKFIETKIWKYTRGSNALMLEQELLYDLQDLRIKKEILVSGGNTEIFPHDISDFIYHKIYKYSYIEEPEVIKWGQGGDKIHRQRKTLPDQISK